MSDRVTYAWMSGGRETLLEWQCHTEQTRHDVRQDAEGVALAHLQRTGHRVSWSRTDRYHLTPLRTEIEAGPYAPTLPSPRPSTEGLGRQSVTGFCHDDPNKPGTECGPLNHLELGLPPHQAGYWCHAAPGHQGEHQLGHDD